MGQLRSLIAGGADANAPVAPGGFLARAMLRRRVRFLQRRRLLALSDLGGFVFEAHRLGEDRREIVSAKLRALDALDQELARVQRGLDDREELLVLREPGISSCPSCSTIHDSSAAYCPGCGRTLRGAPSP